MSRAYTEAELDELILATKGTVLGLVDISVKVGAFDTPSKAKQHNRADIIEAILHAQDLKEPPPPPVHVAHARSPSSGGANAPMWRCDNCKQMKKDAQVSYQCLKCDDFELCTSCFKSDVQVKHARHMGPAHRTYEKINGSGSGQRFDADLDEVDEQLAAAMERQVVISKAVRCREPRTVQHSNSLRIDVTLHKTGLALLIGNSQYKGKGNKLLNCKRDLQHMSRAFEALGFNVLCNEDLTADGIKQVQHTHVSLIIDMSIVAADMTLPVCVCILCP